MMAESVEVHNGEYEDFALTIGHALSCWTTVEQLVGRIFCLAVGARDSEAAYRAFWTVISFRGRLELADAAIKYTYRNSAAILAHWKDVTKILKTENSRRNIIAHGTIVTSSGKDGIITIKFCPYLFQDTLAAMDDALSIEDVKKMPVDFWKANDKLIEFHKAAIADVAKSGAIKLNPAEANAVGLQNPT